MNLDIFDHSVGCYTQKISRLPIGLFTSMKGILPSHLGKHAKETWWNKLSFAFIGISGNTLKHTQDHQCSSLPILSYGASRGV